MADYQPRGVAVGMAEEKAGVADDQPKGGADDQPRGVADDQEDPRLELIRKGLNIISYTLQIFIIISNLIFLAFFQ